MVKQNPYEKYKQSSIETKSQGELTLMLYEGCLKFIRLSEEAIHEKQYLEKNKNLKKAQRIIRELMVTMDTNVEVSRNMITMYDFILAKLVEANTKNSVQALNEAERFVTDFRDTWKEVIKEDRKIRFGGTSEAPSLSNAEAAPSAKKQPAPSNPYVKAKQSAAVAGAAQASFRG